MITIYYSNKLESLTQKLIELIDHQKLENALYPEIILSENVAMMEWLCIRIAKHFGIAANIQFFSSFDFIWSIFRKSLWGVFPEETISHSTISWILMKVLSNINDNNDNVIQNCYISIVKEYLYNDIDQKKLLQLSEKIKSLFIQYFIYHQDWLLKWKNRKIVEELDIHTQSWQSELWRIFLNEVNRNESKKSFWYFQYEIYEYISNFLKASSIKNNIPKRVFIYGISYFPPVLLDILRSFGEYINIYIFCVNPCRYFLKENIHYNNIIRIMRKRSQLFQCFSNMSSCDIFHREVLLSTQKKIRKNIENFLLSFWGKRFQEIFYSLLQLEVLHEESIFIENNNGISSTSLLHCLQNDILNDYSQQFSSSTIISLMKKNINSEAENHLLYSSDYSLSVHICHNIQREIEVLHDNLLGVMVNNPSLLPHEIVVMAPNIECYVETIRSVFSSASIYGRYLPFTIFDNSVNNMNIITSSFLKLLDLPHIKCSIEEILEILSVPAISLRFNINKDEVQLLSTWIIESGIRWGLDDDDIFSDLEMCSDSSAHYSWKFGITRMLLSYSIHSSSGLWNNIFPYDVGGSMEFIDLVGQLSCFLMKLKDWKDRFLKLRTLEEWLPLFEGIINDFYVIDHDTETELTILKLKSFWKEIVNSGIRAYYYDPIPINILRTKLLDRLNRKKINHRFFSGSIIFCNIDSVESIPFKIIYLLGINSNVYPRSNKAALNFDLMQYEARFNDCHAWCDDRYSFLKVLLSAREQLYISLIGNSLYDYTKFFYSILIKELFKYIIQNFFYIEKNTKEILPITMDWIHNNICHWHTHVPFSLKNFISGSKNQSFFKEWLPVFFDNDNSSHGGFLRSLSKIPINTISFDNLYNFYCHSIRAWFQNRLKIYIPETLDFALDEPFSVTPRIKYQICQDLISSFLKKEDINIVYERFRGSGVLPQGNFGNSFWIQQCELMMKLSQEINSYHLPMNRYNSQFSLKFNNNVQLNGVLSNVQKNGLLRWKPGKLSMRDGLLLWLEHVVYCAIGGKGDSWMFGINSSWHFVSLSDLDAKEYLFSLISGYFNGLTTPLLLFSHSGGCWLRHCFDVKKKSISTDLNRQIEARRKLVFAWKGNNYVYGESSDPYVRKLIPQLRNKDIESIISSSKKYFLLLMQFNV